MSTFNHHKVALVNCGNPTWALARGTPVKALLQRRGSIGTA
ncbi:MAG: hypothetical protein ACP5VR_07795 [Acidimicrobiales bacterium]